MALGADGHGDEGDGDLFAGDEELVHFAFGRGYGLAAIGADLGGEVDEVVGGVAHGGDDDDDLVAALFGGDGASGGFMDAFGGGDGGSAEFLND